MLVQPALYLTAIILGSMIFFSFIVAPITFKLLDEENSKKFIRGIFPFYYLLNLFLSLAASILFYLNQNLSTDFLLMVSISILFAFSNFILMPMINNFRDNNEDKKFKISHFVSVIINFIQLIFLMIILL
tara:strand:- start:848 stop:1237 length:390 start_codon:yes stop_codon:yes gene_type:complete